MREKMGRAHLGGAHDDGRSGARHSGDVDAESGGEARLRRWIGEAKQQWRELRRGSWAFVARKLDNGWKKSCATSEENCGLWKFAQAFRFGRSTARKLLTRGPGWSGGGAGRPRAAACALRARRPGLGRGWAGTRARARWAGGGEWRAGPPRELGWAAACAGPRGGFWRGGGGGGRALGRAGGRKRGKGGLARWAGWAREGGLG
jgi:hypothetical protein